MELSSLREATESLTIELARARYRDLAGFGPLEGVAGLFQEWPELATWESLAQVREAAAKSEGRRVGRLRALAHHLVGLVATREAVRQEEAFSRAGFQTMTGASPGEAWPLRTASLFLSQEANRESRAEAERRLLAALQENEGAAAALRDVVRSVFGRAGWESTGQAWSVCHDFDVSLLAAEARSFLADTEAMYLDVFAWWLRRSTGLRPFPHEAERHDLLHALTLREFTGVFPVRTDLTRLLHPFLKSGVDLSCGRRLRLDLDDRPAKASGGLAIPLDAPREVMAVVRPDTGFAAARDLLRAWGEGRHYASIEAERPFEDRLLGDTAVPLAMGRLMQSVLLDRVWVRRATGEEPPDFRRVVALEALFRLRHAAVVLLASLDADQSGMGPGSREQFAAHASSALGARWPADLMRWECDAQLDAGTELLAASLEALLFTHVQDRFDEDWWANPSGVAFLTKLSAQGQVESARALVESLKLGTLSLKPIVARLQSALG